VVAEIITNKIIMMLFSIPMSSSNGLDPTTGYIIIGSVFDELCTIGILIALCSVLYDRCLPPEPEPQG
jgi:hypothetical protein